VDHFVAQTFDITTAVEAHASGTSSAGMAAALRGRTMMRSLALRWSFAILLGSAWNVLEPMIFR
jgi:hypothetical protein